MAEYLLPTVLIGLVVMGGLSWMTSTQFSQESAMKVYQGKAVVSSGQGKFAVQTQEMGANPSLGQFSYVSANGNKITLSNLPSSIVQSIEVNGGQGTTDSFAAALREFADQLLKNKEIDQAQANAIKALADRGFDIGKDLGVFDKLMVDCQFEAKCAGDLFTKPELGKNGPLQKTHGRLSANNKDNDEKTLQFYDLQSLTAIEKSGLKNLFETEAKYKAHIVSDIESITYGASLRRFYEAFGDVNTTSMSAQSLSVLRYLSQSVAFTAQRASNVIYRVSYEKTGVLDSAKVASELEKHNTGVLVVEKPSFLVNEKSGHICTLGNGEVQNGQCH